MDTSQISYHPPHDTDLHRYVLQHYPAWKAERARLGKPVPKLVQREIEMYLRCRDKSHGYAVVGCRPCKFRRILGYSCKRRWCDVCGMWRMHERAKTTINTFDGYPVFHVVGALPNPLRYSMANEPRLLTRVFRCLVDAVFHHQRARAVHILGVRKKHVLPGTATVIHRVSADLRPNVHVHLAVFDGVFIRDPDTGVLTFHRLGPLSHEDIAEIARRWCRTACKVMEKRTIWHPKKQDSDACIYEGTVTMPGWPPESASLTAEAAQDPHAGDKPRAGLAFNVFAGHHIEAGDRAALTQLALYLSAPPLSAERVRINEDGTLTYTMKRSRFDGSVTRTYDPFAFLERIAGLIHRPRIHLNGHHGVISSGSHYREQIIKAGSLAQPKEHHKPKTDDQAALREAKQHLNAMTHRLDSHVCPRCFKRLEVIEVVSSSYRYRNPRWIKPDTPHEVTHADVKTGSRREPETISARSVRHEECHSNVL